jgi:hypothetical protein
MRTNGLTPGDLAIEPGMPAGVAALLGAQRFSAGQARQLAVRFAQALGMFTGRRQAAWPA